MILTEPEINKISGGSVVYFDRIVFARAIESALLEKLRAGVEVPEAAGWMNKNGDMFSKKEAVGFNTSTMKPLYTRDQLLAYGDARALAAREQQWQTIESAPKDGTSVLMFRKGDLWPGVVFYAHGRWSWSTSGQWAGNPTHWAPCLPPPPASPQEQQP